MSAFMGVAVSTLRLRRSRPRIVRPFVPPGGSGPARLAAVGAALLLAAMLVPASPAALAWPGEWVILAVLVLTGAVFWVAGAGSRLEVDEPARARLILGPGWGRGPDWDRGPDGPASREAL